MYEALSPVSLIILSYAKYYFELRTLSRDELSFPLQPLTSDGTSISLLLENSLAGAEILEARSRGAEKQLIESKKDRRARSLESLKTSQERVIGVEEFKQISNRMAV